jgi:hypothetical protein
MTDYLAAAETALRSSEDRRWVACIICAHKIGTYENGFAQELASRMGYADVSRISQLADAGRAWIKMRPYMGQARNLLRQKFRISIYTYCNRIIMKGHAPELIVESLKEMSEEWDRPKDKDVKDGLSGRFGLPPREITTKRLIKYLDELVSWGARKVDHEDRPSWDLSTQTIRRIVRKHDGNVASG